jgi:hypothetical protein
VKARGKMGLYLTYMYGRSRIVVHDVIIDSSSVEKADRGHPCTCCIILCSGYKVTKGRFSPIA